MPRYLHKFEVLPTAVWAEFPIDMLRYDAVNPATEEDSYKVTHSLQRHAMEEPWDGTPIALEGWHERDWEPTVGRWRSFGWDVVRDSHVSEKRS